MINEFEFPARPSANLLTSAEHEAHLLHESVWTKCLAVRLARAEQVETACQLFCRGEFNEAATQFRALLQIALSDGDAALAEVACHNLAAAYRQSRQWLDAVSWQQQSLTWRLRQTEQSPDQSDDALARLACDLTGRGCDAFLNQEWDIAGSLWRRALAIEEWRGSWEGQANDCGNLGLLAAAQGDLDQGIRWLRKSLRLHRLMLDEGLIGTDLMNLAELRRHRGEVSRAIRLLRQAIRSFHRADAAPLRHQAESRLREALRIESLAKHDPLVN